MPSQDMLDYSSQQGAFAIDAAEPASMFAAGSATAGGSAGGARRKVAMRPSMELRCKKLDTSLLQVALPFLPPSRALC
jgi:hypothetical protein